MRVNLPNLGQAVLNVLENTYSAAADAAKWDLANLDRCYAIGDSAIHRP